MRLCLLLLFLLASCGKELEVNYGETRTHSINGLALIKQYWNDRFETRSHRNRTERLEDQDLIIHVVEDTNFRFPAGVDISTISEEIDEADDIDTRNAQTWISDWLRAQSQRQFVLILRDGNVAPQLCKQWANEFEQAAKEKDRQDGPNAGDAFREQARHLRDIALQQQFAPLAHPDNSIDFDFFTLHGVLEQQTKELTGILNGTAPKTMFTRSHLFMRGAEVLAKADERNFILSIPHHNSRLIVVANATPFLDAALVDKQARALLKALTDEVAKWQPEKAVWLYSLNSSGGKSPPPPNVFIQLFTKEPFNYVIIHSLVFLIVFLLWRAAWLGRKQSQRSAVAEQFHQHIDALARHLQRSGKTEQQCEAIAKAIQKDSTGQQLPQSDAEAIRFIQQLYQQDDTKVKHE